MISFLTVIEENAASEMEKELQFNSGQFNNLYSKNIKISLAALTLFLLPFLLLSRFPVCGFPAAFTLTVF